MTGLLAKQTLIMWCCGIQPAPSESVTVSEDDTLAEVGVLALRIGVSGVLRVQEEQIL